MTKYGIASGCSVTIVKKKKSQICELLFLEKCTSESPLELVKIEIFCPPNQVVLSVGQLRREIRGCII